MDHLYFEELETITEYIAMTVFGTDKIEEAREVIVDQNTLAGKLCG